MHQFVVACATKISASPVRTWALAVPKSKSDMWRPLNPLSFSLGNAETLSTNYHGSTSCSSPMLSRCFKQQTTKSTMKNKRCANASGRQSQANTIWCTPDMQTYMHRKTLRFSIGLTHAPTWVTPQPQSRNVSLGSHLPRFPLQQGLDHSGQLITSFWGEFLTHKMCRSMC